MAVKFRQFLYSRGIEDFESRLEFCVRYRKPQDWILVAFDWRKQPEGARFWIKLDNDWIDICKNNEVIY
jgi:hypothetical protein